MHTSSSHRSIAHCRTRTCCVGAIVLSLIVLFAATSFAQQGCLEPPGDITDDGLTNVVDVQCGILVALADLAGGFTLPACLKAEPAFADVNCDDARNVGDVQILVSYTLGQPLNLGVDMDQNGCPDSCEIFIPVCGDDLCTEGAENCFSCPQDCGACAGECCAPNPTPGCQDPGITSMVCVQSPSCCTSIWSAGCVAIAADSGTCPQSCCLAVPTPNCDDSGVASCVCEQHPSCCSTAWDQDCVDFAKSGCGLDCLLVSDCCSSGEVGGCQNVACEACVCAQDPLCCENVWDDVCVAMALTGCAYSQGITAVLDGAQSNPPVPTPAFGSGQFSLNGNVLTYFVQYQGLLAPEIASHLHLAPAGENGPIVVPLPVGTPKVGSAILTPQLAAALLANELYVVVHTTEYVLGELRGQLMVQVTNGPCLCQKPCCLEHLTPGCEVLECEQCVCGADPFCCASAWDASCVELGQGSCMGACGCGTGNCCEANGTSGCQDFECESCVCASDPFCCAVQYDELCASEASLACADVCACEAAECCQAHASVGCENAACESCVCALDDSCCQVAWDSQCAEFASSSCNAVCICAPGDCCAPQSGAGCLNESCETCVCSADSYCCDVQWDELCVGAAGSDCNALCGCLDGPGLLGCCFAHAASGCSDFDCQDCVCSLDSFCCATAWDELCLVSALGGCDTECGCQEGDCCSASGAAGCDNPACSGCVCAIDASCCEFLWDAACADVATGSCNDVCLCEPGDCCAPQSEPGCNTPACESCVCGGDSFCCDVLWDEICVGAAAAQCNAPCQCGTVLGTEPCCTAHASPGCIDQGCQSCVCPTDPFCCASSWDSQCLALASSPTCSLGCGCEGQGDCCFAHGGAACGNSSCAACVCAAHPECCGVVWDAQCAAAAAADCQAACGCGGPNCCEPQPTGGCAGGACQNCVCGIDDFCCAVQWDEICASIATFDCSSCTCN